MVCLALRFFVLNLPCYFHSCLAYFRCLPSSNPSFLLGIDVLLCTCGGLANSIYGILKLAFDIIERVLTALCCRLSFSLYESRDVAYRVQVRGVLDEGQRAVGDGLHEVCRHRLAVGVFMNRSV